MNNRSTRMMLRSFLVAGLVAASPDALGAIDETELLRAFGPCSEHACPAAPAESRTRTVDARAAAFIDAFNSRSLATMASFEMRHRSPENGVMRWFEARLDEYSRLQEALGALDVHAIFPLSDTLMAMTARSQRTGAWLCITLTFEDHSPYLLRTSRIDPMIVPF